MFTFLNKQDMLFTFLKHEQTQSSLSLLCAEHKLYDYTDIVNILFKCMLFSRIKLYTFYIEKNPYIPNEIKKYMLYIYCNAVKKCNRVKRLWVYYIRKKKQSYNTQDLLLNPLTLYKKYDLIDIIDNYKKYTFRLVDLANIIKMSLIHSDEFFFALPILIKNPYTNMNLSIENLYVIYFCMQSRGFPISPLFTLYMLEEFNLQKFSIKFEGILKDYILDNAIDNFDNKRTTDEVNIMFADITIYNYHTRKDEPIFSNTIPMENLLGFKQLLYHYFHYLYSMNSFYRNIEYVKLIKKIIAFKKENPLFETQQIITVPLHELSYKHINIPHRQINVYSLLNIHGF
jgi:hypothetical protein